MKDKHDYKLIAERYDRVIGESIQQTGEGLQTKLNKFITQFPQYEQALNSIKEVALEVAGNIEADAANQDDPNKEEAVKQFAFFLES
jgi:hypothetical protein